ncbi:MAG: glycerophosphodiester phosphodiesterase family protein [Planctomycetota bacterium]
MKNRSVPSRYFAPIVFVLLTLGVAAGLLAAPPDEGVEFSEDFSFVRDGGLPAKWKSREGKWWVEKGGLMGSGETPNGTATLLLGDSHWTDVRLEANVTFVKVLDPSRWFALVIRETGKESRDLQFSVRSASQDRSGVEIAALRKVPSPTWEVLQRSRATVDSGDGQPHRLKVVSRAGTVFGYLDDRLVCRYPRAAEIAKSGRLGFRLNGATVKIDDVRVTRLGPAASRRGRLRRSNPLVIAHRGFSHRAPENTLAAYRLAIETGALLAECDVRLSRDRVPMVIHDTTLDRTTNSSGKVSDFTADQLTRLDAGSWKSPQYRGEKLPTLAELLKLVDGRLRLVIEIKDTGMEREVVQVIREAKVAPESLMIFSFDYQTVKEIIKLEPLLPTTWLVGNLPLDESGWRTTLRDALRARVSAIGLPKDRVFPEFVHLARQCGFPVFVWTVNDPVDMRFLVNAGVSGIISDRPDLALDTVESARASQRRRSDGGKEEKSSRRR